MFTSWGHKEGGAKMDEKKQKCSLPGSNWGPFACEANVIANYTKGARPSYLELAGDDDLQNVCIYVSSAWLAVPTQWPLFVTRLCAGCCICLCSGGDDLPPCRSCFALRVHLSCCAIHFMWLACVERLHRGRGGEARKPKPLPAPKKFSTVKIIASELPYGIARPGK